MATLSECLALARQCHLSGDFGRLEQICRDQLRIVIPIQIGSSCAQLMCEMGKALARQGRVENSIECFHEAVRLESDLAEAHFLLGSALKQLGSLDAAEASFRQGLLRQPSVAAAHNNLGTVLLAQGRPAEAAASFQEALRLQPESARIHNNLGVAWSKLGRLHEAIAQYRQAIRQQPDYGDAQFNLAQALVELGRMNEARPHYREALRTNPNSSLILCSVASKGLLPEAEVGIDRIRRLLTDPGISSQAAAQIHFALGDMLDRAGDCDEAFDHYRQANALHHADLVRRGAAFDAVQHGRRIDLIRSIFSPKYFHGVKGFGLDCDVPIFIVGLPRSGTTLVEQILSSHPQVFGAGEPRELMRIIAALPRRLGTQEAYPACLGRVDALTSRELAEEYLRGLFQRGASGRHITDKTLELYLELGLAATLFPRSRIIHCRRDPMDLCLSCYFHSFRDLNYTWNLADLGQCYRQSERLMKHWQETLPLPILEVVYEDLIADPESVTRRMVSFCGLEWDERCLRFHENPRAVQTASKLQVRRPIYADSIGRWRKYEACLEPLLEALRDAN
jgi:tetratricopeptide (TPR) repeat protein